MSFDPTVIPGLLLLAAELTALAAVGYVVARVTLCQRDSILALAQGLVVGPALWGLFANFVLYVLPKSCRHPRNLDRNPSLGAWLVRRAPHAWRISPREVVGFAAAVTVTFWVALAARQLLVIPDAPFRLGLTAAIQAGNWPPSIPWSPWQPVPYHYGANLLAAAFAPPIGPDLAFTTELLGAYAWMSLAMITGTTLKQRGGWVSWITLTPMLLTAGAWTLAARETPVIFMLPVPTGIAEPGAWTSLTEVYWPRSVWPWSLPEPQGSPPNIWKPFFALGYALAFTVLERVTGERGTSYLLRPLTLAAIVGFLGLCGGSRGGHDARTVGHGRSCPHDRKPSTSRTRTSGWQEAPPWGWPQRRFCWSREAE